MGQKRKNNIKGLPYSVAITSGKGGVGKSCIALNLAAELAKTGKRVLLVDGDLGLGNVGLLLGIGGEWTIEDALSGRCPVAEAAIEGPEGLVILPAATEGETDFWQTLAVVPSVVEELEAFAADFDVLVIDTGAGIADKTVDLVIAADEALVVVTPEPTAIADAYATLKILLLHRSELVAGLLVNMADSAEEAAELHDKFAELASRFLGAEIDNRGYIPLDRYLREAVKRQVPLSLSVPPSPAAHELMRLAGDLGGANPSVRNIGPGFFTRALTRQADGVD